MEQLQPELAHEPSSLRYIYSDGWFLDLDGQCVILSVNFDENDRLFELDSWKMDSNPLLRFPTILSEIHLGETTDIQDAAQP
ncbi:DUF6984 family protein [Psychromicrobium lacuslunae]|uniref:DUF6984 domain-containing protein n=1 Tax=Psychromicrobium lacuslunae TaxID=1618207 RepID=A0A0D4BX61_9MICC|nr:hypothetical protein [Psychromicrobium lacuslunae]AJT40914.1 hypothetical protein UM93_04200 [Psychromicrobium lacuslunae]